MNVTRLPTEAQSHLPPSGSGRKVVVGQQGVFFGQSGDNSVNKQIRRALTYAVSIIGDDGAADARTGSAHDVSGSPVWPTLRLILAAKLVSSVESVAKIRRFAESQSLRDVIDRHLRIAQIFYRHLGPQLVEEIAKRSPFVAQLPTKRAHRDAEMHRGVIQAGVPSQCREQIGAHFSGDADPVLQSIVQVSQRARTAA